MTPQTHENGPQSDGEGADVSQEGRGEIGAVKRFSARLSLAESVILELSDRIDALEQALDGP